MECPVCGNLFPQRLVERHAWSCNGSTLFPAGLLTQRRAFSNTGVDHSSATCASYFHQHVTDVRSFVSADVPGAPHSSTEISQETAMVEAQECPLCCQYFPADQIVEHAAFCNGPSFSRTPEREIPSFSRTPEREIPSFSRTPEREIPSFSRIPEREIPSFSRIPEREIPSEEASNTMTLFWSYINGKEGMIPGTAAEGPRKVPSSREEDASTVLDLEKALQYLEKLEHRITQDPEFKQVFGPLLKSCNPLHILQCLSQSIFSSRVAPGAGKVAPIFLFFHLAKLFLPMGPLLCAFGVFLASGLIVGLLTLLKAPKSKNKPEK
ncbi:uncharacterized protein LOC119956589 isoform X2 [Scyliorhinus canicula]|uniref:uncharacterized protein LOC119956589 isoform X2 n=1 Tax=Scyliorhinus canicula TaxID=7830 RepID=UPI0018F3077D|nr:uncharacterized protein LOC119956589 isoform X2 [Scyliorhinus canicula]